MPCTRRSRPSVSSKFAPLSFLVSHSSADCSFQVNPSLVNQLLQQTTPATVKRQKRTNFKQTSPYQPSTYITPHSRSSPLQPLSVNTIQQPCYAAFQQEKHRTAEFQAAVENENENVLYVQSKVAPSNIENDLSSIQSDSSVGGDSHRSSSLKAAFIASHPHLKQHKSPFRSVSQHHMNANFAMSNTAIDLTDDTVEDQLHTTTSLQRQSSVLHSYKLKKPVKSLCNKTNDSIKQAAVGASVADRLTDSRSATYTAALVRLSNDTNRYEAGQAQHTIQQVDQQAEVCRLIQQSRVESDTDLSEAEYIPPNDTDSNTQQQHQSQNNHHHSAFTLHLESEDEQVNSNAAANVNAESGDEISSSHPSPVAIAPNIAPIATSSIYTTSWSKLESPKFQHVTPSLTSPSVCHNSDSGVKKQTTNLHSNATPIHTDNSIQSFIPPAILSQSPSICPTQDAAALLTELKHSTHIMQNTEHTINDSSQETEIQYSCADYAPPSIIRLRRSSVQFPPSHNTSPANIQTLSRHTQRRSSTRNTLTIQLASTQSLKTRVRLKRGQWQCKQCTFQNDRDRERCEMCQSNRKGNLPIQPEHLQHETDTQHIVSSRSVAHARHSTWKPNTRSSVAKRKSTKRKR